MTSIINTNNIILNLVQNNRELSEIDLEKINLNWDMNSKRGLIDNQILCFSSKLSEGNLTEINVFVENYKNYFAQRNNVIQLGIEPIGVTGITYYNNGKQIIFYVGKRSHKVTQYPEQFEFIPSGSIDVKCITKDRQVQFLEQFKTELREELNINEEAIKELSVLDLIYDRNEGTYDIAIACEIDGQSLVKINSEYVEFNEISYDQLSNFQHWTNYIPTASVIFDLWRSKLNTNSGEKND